MFPVSAILKFPEKGVIIIAIIQKLCIKGYYNYSKICS